jgi:hypothetical protein
MTILWRSSLIRFIYVIRVLLWPQWGKKFIVRGEIQQLFRPKMRQHFWRIKSLTVSTCHTERGKTQRNIRKKEMPAEGSRAGANEDDSKQLWPTPISFPLYGLHHLSSFAQFYYSCSSGENFNQLSWRSIYNTEQRESPLPLSREQGVD